MRVASSVRLNAADGRLLISDAGNHRLRAVTPGRQILTLAGTGNPAFSGDSALSRDG
ncbi:hypothetical protein FRACA_330011 [Frankia canadensis]|uniref:NHL repeat-containing protein n=1 Tax=Frankia canadensis TaxID=1836972 RepID=A0A2I2KUS5_9ACTN|nr:hypothetical protein FRACA_330011 [Frankia canadensis]SOU56698.1 hypothetical protein FRACA_330011 [Frankia canadensis]